MCFLSYEFGQIEHFSVFISNLEANILSVPLALLPNELYLLANYGVLL